MTQKEKPKMKLQIKTQVILGVIAVGWITLVPVRAETTISTGHADIFGLGYVNGQLELLIHAELAGTEVELDPASTIIRVNPAGYGARPAGTSFDFLGASSSFLWTLPQDAVVAGQRGILFPGVGTEEIDPDVWGSGLITITLKSFGSNPGNLFLWNENEFGEPTLFMDSTRLTQFNSISQGAGVHEHYIWGFTEEGTYTMVFEATGTAGLSVDGGTSQSLSSGEVTYKFQVVPEPSSSTMLLIGLVGWVATRKRALSKG